MTLSLLIVGVLMAPSASAAVRLPAVYTKECPYVDSALGRVYVEMCMAAYNQRTVREAYRAALTVWQREQAARQGNQGEFNWILALYNRSVSSPNALYGRAAEAPVVSTPSPQVTPQQVQPRTETKTPNKKSRISKKKK